MNERESQIWTTNITDVPLPPLANLQDVQNDARPSLKYYQMLGPVYRLPREDNKPLVILVGPEANMFTSRYGDEFFMSAELWKDFNNAMGGMAGGMTTMRDGEANRKRRASTSHEYARTQVLDQLPHMIEITHQHAQWQPGQSIEVLPSMQRIVAEQLGQLLVNYSVGDYLEDLVIYLSTSIVSSFGSKKRDILASPRFQRARERVFELGRLILEAHRTTPAHERKPDIVDARLTKAAEHPEMYPDERLVYVGLGPLLAGLETVARTNTFLFYAVLKNPAALRRVTDEADRAFAQGPLSWETLKSMHDVQGAAMETLRMYTDGGFSAVVAKPFTFAGYRLMPGDEVLVEMTIPHHLPNWFPQPETFDIDRYRDPRNEHRQRGAYAPFGLGEHSCLGAGIAEVQLMVITATLLHTYQFELDPPDYQLPANQPLSIDDDANSRADTQFCLKVVGRRS